MNYDHENFVDMKGCYVFPDVKGQDVTFFRECVLKVSQELFSNFYAVPIQTLKAWENGKTKPDLSILKMTHTEDDFRQLNAKRQEEQRVSMNLLDLRMAA